MFSPRKALVVVALVGVLALSGNTSAKAAETKKKKQQDSDNLLALLSVYIPPTQTTPSSADTSLSLHTLATTRANRSGVSASALTFAQRQFIFQELRYLRIVEQQTLRLLRLERNLGLISPYDWYIKRTQVIVTYIQKQGLLAAQLTGSAPFSPII